ncbi:MAG: hypothetical protein JXA46_07010 [Dehalococcoidales bacterium]|nr:hypothetical protein [Dehalococcoidales bacterium]
MKRSTREQRESFSIIRGIFRAIVGPVLFAFVFVIVLAVIHYFLSPYVSASRFQFLLNIDEETSKTLLGIVAQVAGVFLALYFTAVSVVASTVYARVPGEIRELLTREKIGNLYIQIVALTVAVATLLLGKSAFGFSISSLDVLIVILLSIITIFSFIVLGLRIFSYFDPTKLAEYLGYDLARWFKAATPKGFQWNNSSFQYHYQKQAERLLMTYRKVTFLATHAEYFDGTVLTSLMMQPLLLLQLYISDKVHIPSNSNWFKKIYSHRDWLTADSTETELALHSGTSLHPESVPDLMWFEKNIGETLVEVFRTLAKENDFSNTTDILDNIQRTQSVLSKNLAIEESLYIYRVIQPLVFQIAFFDDTNISALREDEEKSLLTRLGIIDFYCLEPINILLGLSDTLDKITADTFTNALDAINWNKSESIYTAESPREVIKQLEYLQERIRFEFETEGRYISPKWYRNQLTAFGMVSFIKESVEKLVVEYEKLFMKQTENLITEKRYLNAAQMIDRGLEACNKFTFHVDKIRACYDRLSTLHLVKDIPWPSTDWDSLSMRVLKVKESLITSLAKSSVALSEMPFRKTWPDYFGQSFLVLAEECDNAMVTGNDTLFNKIFPAYFNAALKAHDRLRVEIGTGTNQEAALVFITEPIEDLMHISGYALIYSELDGKKYWDTAKRCWNLYFDNHEKPKEVIESINAFAKFRESVFAILPRATLRIGWQRKLEKRLRYENLLFDDSYGAFPPIRPTRPKHASKIIQVISRGIMGTISHDGQDVFLAMYLAKRSEVPGLELTHKAQDFLNIMELLSRNEETEDDSE